VNLIRGIEAIPEGIVNPVVTIGNFDGVHLGHKRLLERVVRRADDIGGTGVVITFEPHPLKILKPDKAPRRLISFQEKIDLLRDCEIKVMICIDFTIEFAKKEAEDFVKEVLYERIGTKILVVGHDFAFGKGRKGNADFLREKGKSYGFEVEIVEPYEMDGYIVSSSLIREALSKGDVSRAARFLGRHYTVEGIVTAGHYRGASIGYPTANIYIVDETIPRYGIYAVKVEYGHEILDGVCYIGTQPTFDGDRPGIEVHLFDFKGNLYHEHLKIFFIDRIRGEQKFQDKEELVRQIRDDVEKARDILSRVKGLRTN